MRDQTDIPLYLVLKANAGRLPLKNESADLVIATPPYIGARLLRKGDFCTSDETEYNRMIGSFLAEALRVVKSDGHILLTTSRAPSARRRGARKVTFQLLRKQRLRRGWAPKTVGSESFWTQGQILETTCWMAIPERVYRELL
jgi:tRNA G10  N-methylase Trm11